VVENRPGGSGTLGPGQMAATAKPDGYTIAQIPITVFRFPFMTKTTFDPAPTSPTSSGSAVTRSAWS